MLSGSSWSGLANIRLEKMPMTQQAAVGYLPQIFTHGTGEHQQESQAYLLQNKAVCTLQLLRVIENT